MRPKKIILCVDDNEQELSVLKFMLSTNGYKVVSASNGQEAISLFSANQVDLVLADFNMQPMNGDQLVHRLKAIAGHVPMILFGDPHMTGGEIHVADAMLAKKNCSTQESAGADQADERPQARPAQGRAARGGGADRAGGCVVRPRFQVSGFRDQISRG